MEKLRRIFNLYKTQIIAIVFFIIFIIIILQVLNNMAKNNNKNSSLKISQSSDYGKDYGIISGEIKNKNVYEKETSILQNFIDYCNEQKYEDAYNLLTDECKEILYPNINAFIQNYCKTNFDKKKTCKIQAWNENTYKIEIRDNVMATGEYKEYDYVQDFYTLQSGKININKYVKREKVSNEKEKENVTIKVNYIDYFIDYTEINISVVNNNEYKILLDTQEDENTIVLCDSNELEYTSNINEMDINKLIINENTINEYTLRFELSYREEMKLTKIKFKNILKETNNRTIGEIEIKV